MKSLHIPEKDLIDIINALEKGLPVQGIIQHYKLSDWYQNYVWTPTLEPIDDQDNLQLKRVLSENLKLRQVIDEMNLENRILRWIITKIISPNRQND
jgi:hypothetical protein